MLATIEGVYENGLVIFKETPPTKKKSKIFITFFDEVEEIPVILRERPFGTLKGTFQLSDNFNDPLDDFEDYM